MTELGTGPRMSANESASRNDAATDSRPERQQNDIVASASRPERALAPCGRVRIVVHHNWKI